MSTADQTNASVSAQIQPSSSPSSSEQAGLSIHYKPFAIPMYLQRYLKFKEIFAEEKVPIESIADLGCGEGKAIRFYKHLPDVTRIVAVDKSMFELDMAMDNGGPLIYDCIVGRKNELNVTFMEGDVTKHDSRLVGIHAVACIELVEHLNKDDLENLVDNVFGYFKPRFVYITTPNRDFNVLFPMKNKFRHYDHKFEWTRDEFAKWCTDITTRYPNYSVEITGVGDPPKEVPEVGFCTQIAVFRANSWEPENVEKEILTYKNVYQYDIPQWVKPPTRLSPFDWNKAIREPADNVTPSSQTDEDSQDSSDYNYDSRNDGEGEYRDEEYGYGDDFFGPTDNSNMDSSAFTKQTYEIDWDFKTPEPMDRNDAVKCEGEDFPGFNPWDDLHQNIDEDKINKPKDYLVEKVEEKKGPEETSEVMDSLDLKKLSVTIPVSEKENQ